MAPHRRHVLTPVSIKNKGPGRHADGGGLYLLVDPSGAKRWVLRTVVQGRRVDMGLGRYSPTSETGSLSAARKRAEEYRDIARAGGDPLAQRAARRADDRVKGKSFREFAIEYVETHRSEWKNAKHAAQWKTTLEKYAYPVFGEVPVGKVDSAMVVEALRPVWTKLPETASRLRGRLETIFDAAKATKLRAGDNPAEWAGSLQASLPRHSRKQRIVHHPALPYREVGAFMALLPHQAGVAARALQFAILTAARTNEVVGARWEEFDMQEKSWTIPKTRMKAKKPHRVPLSRRIVEILEALPRDSEFLFPGRSLDRPMSNMAMLAVLKRMERTDITVHGFRSTFRDWAGEQTAYAREVIEHALAHQLADESEAAYQRGDLLRKRRALMDDWATYCSSAVPKNATVTPMRRKNTAA